jgi:UDP-N-acetylglucosamine 2-epimerase
MGVKSVNIGTRQNSRLKGKNIIDCDYTEESIIKALNSQIKNKEEISSQHLYGNGDAAKEISEVLVNASISNTQKLISY